MKKTLTTLLIMIVLMLVLVPAAFAQPNLDPEGSCPPGFELHEVGEHEEHEDHHIGTHNDRNDDGYLCVKHLKNDRHVHVDNSRPLD